MVSHKKFADKLQLPFSLLVDQDQKMHEEFGVLRSKKIFGKISLSVERSTFIINQQGVIIKEFRNVSAKGHALEILKYIQELHNE
mgnify:CR=1 FL=1